MVRLPRWRRRRRGERGAVAVEFALITPMLCLLVFGILEFGYMINRDMIVGNASRDAARTASFAGDYNTVRSTVVSGLSQEGMATTSPTTTIQLCIKAAGATTPCSPMSQTTYDAAAQSGATAVVKVTYRYNWITPFIGSLFGNATTLGQTTEMRIE